MDIWFYYLEAFGISVLFVTLLYYRQKQLVGFVLCLVYSASLVWIYSSIFTRSDASRQDLDTCWDFLVAVCDYDDVEAGKSCPRVAVTTCLCLTFVHWWADERL